MAERIDKMEIQDTIIRLIREIAKNDDLDVETGQSLIEVYGLDSLDLLDLAFNIEEIYGVKIGKDELSGKGKGVIKKEEMFDENGFISEPALDLLKRNIPEIPPERFKYGLKPADIPRLLNIAVFTRLVYDKLTGGAA